MYVCVNPISICNKFKNLGRNSDSYSQVKEYARIYSGLRNRESLPPGGFERHLNYC